MGIFDFVAILPGYLMSFLSDLVGGNFALAVFIFTLLINIILLPLSIKSQKSSVQQTRIKPKLDELKKRYGDDRQKLMEAQQKLYQEEGVSMSGGCLPMIVRLVLMLSIYQIILSPLTYMARADKQQVDHVTAAVSDVVKDMKDEKIKSEYFANWSTSKGARNQLSLIKIIRENDDLIKEILPEDKYKAIEKDYEAIKKADKENYVNYDFFSIDLTEKPEFSFDIFNHWQKIWIMPILAFLAQMLTSIISSKLQKKTNPDAPSMAGLMLTMPVVSLVIGFSFNGGVTFYWACSSLIGGVIQIMTQQFYGPHKMLAKERIKELVQEYNTEEAQLKKIRSANTLETEETTKFNSEVVGDSEQKS